MSKLKFSIDQKVWYMSSNEPCEGIITKVIIKKNNDKSKTIHVYEIDSRTVCRLEEDLSCTKEELMKKIFKI